MRTVRSTGGLFLSVILTSLFSSPAAAQTVFDDFPVALPLYTTGGWQGPGATTDTGGTVTPSLDGLAILMDGTFNAMAFAARKTPPDFLDFEFYFDFRLVKRDQTEADSFALVLRFLDPALPQGCCEFLHGTSGVWLNFHVGRRKLLIYEEQNGITECCGPQTLEIPIAPFDGKRWDLRLRLVAGFLTIMLDGGALQPLHIGALLPGVIGLQSYRADVNVDDLRFTNLCPSATSGDCDGDGVPDASDICPRNLDPTQADSDSDGVGDACDPCPADLINDPDADGLCAVSDNCPRVANPGQEDFDADAQGNVCDLDDNLVYVTLQNTQGLLWQMEDGFDSWNVYRGDLSVLLASQIYAQDPSVVPLAARVCGLTDTFLLDSFQPPRGSAVFYLTTGSAGGVEGTLGTDSAGHTRPNTFPCQP